MLIMSRIFVVYDLIIWLNNLVTHTLVFRCLLHTFTVVLHLLKELEGCFRIPLCPSQFENLHFINM